MKPYFIPRLRAGKEFTQSLRAGAGFTLVEVLLTISILGLVLVAMSPFFRTVYTAWNFGDRKTELQQNGRVGLEMMSRILRQAKRIIGIPASGSGNFVKFREANDAQTIIFFHNLPSSPYYIGNTGLIRENDLVMRTYLNNVANNALLAKSLENLQIDFKDAEGQLTTKPYDVYSIDIGMSLSDPDGLISDTIEIFSSVSLRAQVRINKPVWVAEKSNIVELSTDNWISGFFRPSSVSVNAATGECWVADPYFNRIKKYSAKGELLFTKIGFQGPQSVSVNSTTGECWVADTFANVVKKVSADGSQITTYTGFSFPMSVSVNSATPTGDCWVADTLSNTVKKISASGTIATYTGFSFPMSVSVNSATPTGDCWVADTASNTVKKISANGKIKIRTYKGFRFPVSVSVNSATPTGDCWVADTLSNTVKKISASGKITAYQGFSSPRSVSVNINDGSCWAANTGNNEVVKLDSEGNEEFRISGFQSPLSVGTQP